MKCGVTFDPNYIYAAGTAYGMCNIWLLTIDYQREFTDFRVLVLDDNPFLVDMPTDNWSEFSRLARSIRDLGRHNFLTKNVRQPGTDASRGTTLGKLNVDLTYYDIPGQIGLQNSFYGFCTTDCDFLRDSRLYPAVNRYVANVVRPGTGTIFFG